MGSESYQVDVRQALKGRRDVRGSLLGLHVIRKVDMFLPFLVIGMFFSVCNTICRHRGKDAKCWGTRSVLVLPLNSVPSA